jgi:hypothetical protein
MKPATSSDSASGRSKGGRLVSASAEMKNRTTIGRCGSQYQLNKPVGPVLRRHDAPKVHRAGRDDDADDDQAQRDLVGNHLRRRPQRPQEGVFRVRRPAAHDHAVNLKRGDGEDEQDRHVDVGQHPALIEGDHRPGQDRQHEGQHRRQEEHRAVDARRNDDFLHHIFQRIGHRLQQAERPHHVRPLAHLHRGPDLAVAIDQEQQADHHEGHDQQALRRDQDRRSQGRVKNSPSCPVPLTPSVCPVPRNRAPSLRRRSCASPRAGRPR